MHELGAQDAWKLLLECSRLAHDGHAAADFSWCGDRLTPVGEPCPGNSEGKSQSPFTQASPAVVRWDGVGQWGQVGEFDDAIAHFLALYLPVCAAGPEQPATVGHLGQSLDGYVATSTGDSDFVNDVQNIVHLHRMRALCDAIIVGGATVRDDDPGLTVRLATGANPLRVVIDPRNELESTRKIFTDGAAPTLRVILQGVDVRRAVDGEHVQLLRVPADANGRPDLRVLVNALQQRGCHAVFVEGGGITVSRFIDAGLLDRMQVAVAPMFIGQGRAGIRIAGQASLQDCPRPSHRLFRMGADVLFDCDLTVDADRGANTHSRDREAQVADQLPVRLL